MSLLAGLSQQGDSIAAHNGDAAAHLSVGLKQILEAQYVGQNYYGEVNPKIVFIGDSTLVGGAATATPRRLADSLAAKYPFYSVLYCGGFDVSGGSPLLRYKPPVRVSTGTNGVESISLKPRRLADPTWGGTVGNFEIQGRVKHGGAFSPESTILSKFGNSGSYSFRFWTNQQRRAFFYYSVDGTTEIQTIKTTDVTEVFPADSVDKWMTVSVVCTADNGAGGADFQFRWRYNDNDAWTNLGTVKTGPAVISSLYASTYQWELGARSGSPSMPPGFEIQYAYFLDANGNNRLPATLRDWTRYDTSAACAVVGAPVILVQNAGWVGSSFTEWSQAALTAAAKYSVNASLVIVAIGHNELAEVGAAEYARMDTFLGYLRTAGIFPNSEVLWVRQNPEKDPRFRQAEYNRRHGELVGWLRKNGLALLDFFTPLTLADISDVDGVHPVDSGYIKQTAELMKYL